MNIRFAVTDYIPAPARTVHSVVQMAAKCSRKMATQLIHEGCVKLRGRSLTQPHLRLNIGDQIDIDFTPQPTKKPAAKTKQKSKHKSAGTFEVVHDDPHIVVVNKPAGLLTVPSPKRERNTLLSQLERWCQRNSEVQQLVCVQRLDRGVSGLLVFAKHEQAGLALRSQFAARKPKRNYVAIVAGDVARQQATIRSFLTTNPKTLDRYSVADPEEGELAVTRYRVSERWGVATLLQVQLETGRRNQIRVHMAEMGHPIIGDPRYRPDLAAHPAWNTRRLALHAETLGFRHPESGESLQFSSSWPQEFRDLRRKLSKR